MTQQPIFKMSRESRKLFEFLGSCCTQHGITTSPSARDIYMADMLMIKYYPAPIINIIKTRMRTMKNWTEKHGTVEYWLPVIINMLGKSTSATRPTAITPDWLSKSEDVAIPSFAYVIGNYLITDYGYDDLVGLQRIVNTYDMSDIVYACGVGKQNNVYEIRYIRAVIEKEVAKKQIEVQKVENLGKRIESSDRLLNDVVHEHTVMDLAMVEYNWKRASENAELERMWKERFGK